MELDNEPRCTSSEGAGNASGWQKAPASGLPSEAIGPKAVRELAGEGDNLIEDPFNEETLKVIRDAERGIGLSRPFNSVDEMLESLLSEGDE